MEKKKAVLLQNLGKQNIHITMFSQYKYDLANLDKKKRHELQENMVRGYEKAY